MQSIIFAAFFVTSSLATKTYINFIGYDSSGSDISYLATPFLACPALCDNYPTCVGYVEESSAGVNCWFKSSVAQGFNENSQRSVQLVTKPARDYTTQDNIAYDGSDIMFFRGPWSQCNAACDALPGCVGYIKFYENGADCFLKRASAFVLSNLQPRGGQVAVLLTSLVTNTRPYIKLANIVFDGQDITGKDGVPASACAAFCSAQPGCINYVVRPGTQTGCWLKNGSANMRTSKDNDTYLNPFMTARTYKRLRGVSFQKGEVGVFSSTFSDCAVVCDNTAGCVGYSYSASMCHIMSEFVGLFLSKNASTYVYNNGQ
jgi:PAN domain